MPKCRDIMTTDPVSVAPDESVQRAAELMKSNHVGPIPVVNREKKLVGIVTDRDLAIKIVAEGREAGKTRVAEVMTREPVICGPNDDVEQVIQAMEEHQVRRIPIVDENRRLVGIIAQADIATRMDEPRKVAEAVEEISRPTEAESRR